jgi:hypothetical protein
MARCLVNNRCGLIAGHLVKHRDKFGKLNNEGHVKKKYESLRKVSNAKSINVTQTTEKGTERGQPSNISFQLFFSGISNLCYMSINQLTN